MDTVAIRQIISQAKAQDNSYQNFAAALSKQQESLHRLISVPDQGGAQALLDFTIRYIEHVPDFIDAVANSGSAAGVTDYVEPFLAIATHYFTTPPDLITADHSGLDSLLDEAYLAHRLIEEVNDKFIAKAGAPVIPMDTTMANLIVHNLIGEPFANELDEAVHHTVEMMMVHETVYDNELFGRYLNQQKQGHYDEIWAKWPCLTENLDVGLNLKH